MNKLEIIKQFSELETGSSIVVNYPSKDLKFLVSDFGKSIKIISSSIDRTTLVKVRSKDEFFTQKVIKICKNLDSTEPKQITGPLAFTRTIVWRFNKTNDRNIKVRKITDDLGLIVESIETKKIISEYEYNFEVKKNEERLKKLYAKIDFDLGKNINKQLL
jgi:hypothetical protein